MPKFSVVASRTVYVTKTIEAENAGEAESKVHAQIWAARSAAAEWEHGDEDPDCGAWEVHVGAKEIEP